MYFLDVCVCVHECVRMHWTDNNWMMCKFEYVTTRCAKEFTSCWLYHYSIVYLNQKQCVYGISTYPTVSSVFRYVEHWIYSFLTELHIQKWPKVNEQWNRLHSSIHTSVHSIGYRKEATENALSDNTLLNSSEFHLISNVLAMQRPIHRHSLWFDFSLSYIAVINV